MSAPLQILLVEDNQTDILIAEEALDSSELSYTLHTVTDGEAAVKFLCNTAPYEKAPRPHVVFLDLNLPRKDGREVLAEIKSIPKLRNIPIIVLSTSESDTDVSRAYNLHANCYLVKPSSVERFSETLVYVFKLFTQSLRLNHECA